MTCSTLQFPRNPGLPPLILTGQGRELDPRFCLHFQKWWLEIQKAWISFHRLQHCTAPPALLDFANKRSPSGNVTPANNLRLGSLPLGVWRRISCLRYDSPGLLPKRQFSGNDPLHINCTLGCQIFGNGTNRTFYEVLVNGTDFLRFNAANQSWVPLQETPVASYTRMQLNKYNETSADPAFFLKETCIKIVTEHTEVKGAFTGKHEGRSHTPLVIGISLGALAVMALALCIFLCTGGKR
ncbi:endothelial protein C receptor-like isoform X3 [Podarcis muralis]